MVKRNVDKEHNIYQRGFTAGEKHSEPSPITTKFMEDSKEVSARQEERMNSIEKHIETTNQEMGEVRDKITIIEVSVAKISTDVDWLKKNHWMVLTTSFGTFLSVVGGVVLFFLTR